MHAGLLHPPECIHVPFGIHLSHSQDGSLLLQRLDARL